MDVSQQRVKKSRFELDISRIQVEPMVYSYTKLIENEGFNRFP
jgi:CRISPR/Cas system-associated endoribonuclease Cas2